MSQRLRARLVGSSAVLGEVPAADVANLLLGIERVLARASGQVLGRTVKSTGRWGSVIERAARIRLVAVESGSVVGVLELPDLRQDMPPGLGMDTATLSEMALDLALDSAEAGESAQPEVAWSFVRMLDDLRIGTRYDAVVLEPVGDSTHQSVVIDEAQATRLRSAARRSELLQSESLVGTLVEADFERRTARLRTLSGQAIAVSFDETLADDIHEALRRQTELVGDVRYDPGTMTAAAVRLRQVTHAEQLSMGLQTGDFWGNPAVEELARERGVVPIEDLSVLRDSTATPEEIEAFLAAIGD